MLAVLLAIFLWAVEPNIRSNVGMRQTWKLFRRFVYLISLNYLERIWIFRILYALSLYKCLLCLAFGMHTILLDWFDLKNGGDSCVHAIALNAMDNRFHFIRETIWLLFSIIDRRNNGLFIENGKRAAVKCRECYASINPLLYYSDYKTPERRPARTRNLISQLILLDNGPKRTHPAHTSAHHPTKSAPRFHPINLTNSTENRSIIPGSIEQKV